LDDAEINFWSEPAIEINLALAEVSAFFQRAEIKKAKVHRLLHFENERRSDEHPRNVDLNHAHFSWAERI